jgi:hypothetical protein
MATQFSSSSGAAQDQSQAPSGRGRGLRGGRGFRGDRGFRGSRGGRGITASSQSRTTGARPIASDATTTQVPIPVPAIRSLPAPMIEPKPEGAEDAVEADVCFICASDVVHQCLAPCNHRTCHICGLRMRALYKNRDCAHCRVCKASVHQSQS